MMTLTAAERTLHNQRLGHRFFWILRSETKQKYQSIKFILILEAYLRAAPAHLHILEQQKTILNRLQSLNDCLVVQDLQAPLQSQAKRHDLFAIKLERLFRLPGTDEEEAGFVCPLEPRLRCQARPLVADCLVMRSKKRPQRMVFENQDAVLLGEDAGVRRPHRIAFMYKSGDDLRQDSLVLNLLQVSRLRYEENVS
jgi:phosphatidylinositol-4,5-bisphosphate 3-kinase